MVDWGVLVPPFLMENLKTNKTEKNNLMSGSNNFIGALENNKRPITTIQGKADFKSPGDFLSIFTIT